MRFPWNHLALPWELPWCFRGNFYASMVRPWRLLCLHASSMSTSMVFPWCFHGGFPVRCFHGEDGRTVLIWELQWWFHDGAMGTPMGLRWKPSAPMETVMVLPCFLHAHGTPRMLPWDFHGMKPPASMELLRCSHRNSMVLPWGLP